MFKSNLQKLRNAIEFTRIYKANSDDIYIREAKCLDFQLRHILVPMDENDGIAGRYEHDFAGFTSQVGGYSAQIGCCYTYYFDEFDFLLAMRECESELTEEEKAELSTVHMFWHEETTARKLDLAFAKRYGYVPPKGYQGAGAGNCDCRVAGTNLDFEKLMTLGFDGLDREIDAAAEKNGASSFYTALKMWIESLRGACARYREQALAFSETAQSETARRRFAALADALLAIQHNPPKTFLEGVQLMWIYAVSSDLMNYGRMDDYLGGLYAADVDAGRITQDEAWSHARKNVITHHLGMPLRTEQLQSIISERMPLQVGDCFLICSDGVNDNLRDNEIKQVFDVRQPVEDIAASVAKTSVQHAQARHVESDNVTAVVVKVMQVADTGEAERRVRRLKLRQRLSAAFAALFAAGALREDGTPLPEEAETASGSDSGSSESGSSQDAESSSESSQTSSAESQSSSESTASE